MQNNLDRLDLMIAYSCNISCRGCISLSDFKRDGVAPYKDIKEWIDYWCQLVTPKVLTIFGGEPCIHPKLTEICELVRNAWPNTTIRLITNGYLLENFDPAVWFRFAPFEMQISVHRLDHENLINKQIKQILLQRRGWIIEEEPHRPAHEQVSWSVDGVKIYKSIFKDFVVPFKLENNYIKPWSSSPEEAHKICGAPNTPILYKGKLYKCPAVANAIDLSGENWFGYEPCADSSQLTQFLAGVGVPEPVCAQCPNQQQAVIIDHFDKNNVTVKQSISN